MTAPWPVVEGVLQLGDLQVEGGGTIASAELAYGTFGTLSPERDNVIVYPCSYTASHRNHDELTWLIGPDGVLDPTRWFVVVPDMFSNGLSSSASQRDPFDPTAWPRLVTIADNVRAQRRLLTEVWGIERVAAVYGYSMGGAQAYHWASMYPDAVAGAVVVSGSARTSVHNQVVLTGLLRILEAAPEHLGGGRFRREPTAAKRAFATVFAGWGLSPEFFRAGAFPGASSLAGVEEFLQGWIDVFDRFPAADLHAQAQTWLHADVTAGGRHGDLARRLEALRARVLLVPSSTDQFFPLADSVVEAEHLRRGQLSVMSTIWGHSAGSPLELEPEKAFLVDTVRTWLDTPDPPAP